MPWVLKTLRSSARATRRTAFRLRAGKKSSHHHAPCASSGCQRIERDGLVVLRMVHDPTDLPAVRRAASAHEAWIGPVIGAPIDDEWE